MTLEEIGKELGFETKSKNYRKAFYDKYIRKENINLDIIIKYYGLINIFNLNDKINWFYISKQYILSENFMREFQKYVNWNWISMFQKLSEDFIREFKDKIYWYWISRHQKLSDDFIREFKDKVDWPYISKNQKLSKEFVEEFKNELDINLVKKYQYFDKEFEHTLKDLNNYKVEDGYVYGYKAVRTDRYSLYNFHYQYLDGSIHESFSDQTSEENSFGLSIGTKDFAINYGKNYDNGEFILLYVRTKISDITRIVHKGQKLRTRKLEILNEVK